jgi:hypothetical protein
MSKRCSFISRNLFGLFCFSNFLPQWTKRIFLLEAVAFIFDYTEVFNQIIALFPLD